MIYPSLLKDMAPPSEFAKKEKHCVSCKRRLPFISRKTKLCFRKSCRSAYGKARRLAKKLEDAKK